MVLQPNFFSLLSAQDKINELLPFYQKILYYLYLLNKGTSAPATRVFHHKKKHLNLFFRKRHLNVLTCKNFLFPKIDFERDVIPAKI